MENHITPLLGPVKIGRLDAVVVEPSAATTIRHVPVILAIPSESSGPRAAEAGAPANFS